MRLKESLYTLSEIVLIRRGNPRNVIVFGGAHYFCWFWDLYKPFDYEPVIVVALGGKPCAVTRYHWNGVVVWNNPVTKEGKPILDFYVGIHTPLIITTRGRFALITDLTDLTPIEKKLLLHMYLPIIIAMLEGRIDVSVNQAHGYREKIIERDVPKEYIFEPRNWKYLIVVGDTDPMINVLPAMCKKTS